VRQGNPILKVRAIVPHEGRVLVARERRQGKPHTTIPGGRLKRGETLEEALVREVREETGVIIDPVRLLYIAEVVNEPRIHDVNLIYLAHAEDPLDAARDGLLDPGEPGEQVMPPVLAQVAEGIERGFQYPLASLGNVWDSSLAVR
jgi:ADP-ribose pyrophosphatase YjhB (NUDIX family)